MTATLNARNLFDKIKKQEIQELRPFTCNQSIGLEAIIALIEEIIEGRKRNQPGSTHPLYLTYKASKKQVEKELKTKYTAQDIATFCILYPQYNQKIFAAEFVNYIVALVNNCSEKNIHLPLQEITSYLEHIGEENKDKIIHTYGKKFGAFTAFNMTGGELHIHGELHIRLPRVTFGKVYLNGKQIAKDGKIIDKGYLD